MNEAVPIGPWERLLGADQRRDNGQVVGWMVALDRDLEGGLVAAALEAVRPAFPLYFARIEEDGRAARLEPRRPIADFVREVGGFEGEPADYLRLLANASLDPVRDGLFRCHLVTGRAALLAFQCAHVGGDGYTAGRFRTAFAAACRDLAAGKTPHPSRAPAVHDLSVEAIKQVVPFDAGQVQDMVRRSRLREPVMTERGGAAEDATELRIFQAGIDRELYAPIIAEARGLQVTPLALLGASLALAARDSLDPWSERPGDYVPLAIPRDLRPALGLSDAIGNLSVPFGVPLYAEDPRDRGRLALRLFDWARRGQGNRLLYRPFLARLARAETATLADLAPPPRLEAQAESTLLRPFAAFGVTEIPHRGEVEALGPARVVETLFQTPLLTRRFAGGRVHLSCTVAWHERFDARLKALFAATMRLHCPNAEWSLL